MEESLLLLRLSSFLYALGETMERLFLEEEASYSSEACSPADEVEKEVARLIAFETRIRKYWELE